ncbi:hypothetical protein [Bacillus salipaludis]|uniref:hypothetical protein n=1 Tax=Bacillus salipaludis TaxID=2547811 RepID=UPI002E20E2CA|nr:hypothetical protein [Bacillus salipaludis]
MGFLVGVKEAGEILGWDRRKVSTYHLRGVLPKPLINLSSGPIWFSKQIENYKTGKNSREIIYYIDDKVVYECGYNNPMKKTNHSPEEIKECAENFIIYQEKDIELVINAILEKNPIVQFLSFESISFLHDLGILNTDIFNIYIHQYPFESIKPF